MGSNRVETYAQPAADPVPGNAAIPACTPSGAAGFTTAQPAAATAEEVEAFSGRASDVEFHIAVDIIYNRARARWLLALHRTFLFGSIVAGSIAAGDLVSPKACAVAAAVLAALDLVFDPGAAAAAHREVVRETHGVLTRLRKAKFDEAEMDRADADLMGLSATAGAPYCVQRSIAHNEAITALGRDRTHRAPIGWRRCLAQVLRFEGW